MTLRSSSGISRQRIQWDGGLSAVCRIVGGRIGLPVVLGLGDHDAIDKNAGNQHLPRMQRARSRDPFDLDDHDATGILDRHRHGEIVEIERLAFGRDITVRIRSRPSQKGDLEGKPAIEQPFLPVDFDQADDVFA